MIFLSMLTILSFWTIKFDFYWTEVVDSQWVEDSVHEVILQTSKTVQNIPRKQHFLSGTSAVIIMHDTQTKA